jgi:GNAT superfamily N-acetyltransferase
MLGVLSASFPGPGSRRGWALAAATAPDYESFVARIGDRIVGVGSLSARGGVAWIGGGATLARWRGRGVHSALIAARLRRAARLGCRWAWAETAAPEPGRPQGSRRNLLRLGFEEACVKRQYIPAPR